MMDWFPPGCKHPGLSATLLFFAAVALFFGQGISLFAQSVPESPNQIQTQVQDQAQAQAPVTSRAQEIEQARQKKLKELKEENLSGIEKGLNTFQKKKVMERITAGSGGFTFVMGGLATGQGFALGPGYLRKELADGQVFFRTSARASLQGAQLYDLQLGFPRLGGNRLFIDLLTQHRNYPRVEYYGPGPDSLEGNRTVFRLEDTSFDFKVGFRPVSAFQVGVHGGVLQVNTGRGSRTGIASIEEVFTEATTPGLTNQTDFFRGGGWVQFDNRDNPGGPRSGGNYFARFTYYDDTDLKLYSFQQMEFEAQQYIPFFNKRRVIVLRARTVLTYSNGGQVVPFYMQPVLGGSDDIRGFPSYRFHDDNLIVANLEYRWESFSGLDMALFFDAGKVVPGRSQVNFHDLETSAGFGFRFNVANSVFLRFDLGFSHEGSQFWLKFDNPF